MHDNNTRQLCILACRESHAARLLIAAVVRSRLQRAAQLLAPEILVLCNRYLDLRSAPHLLTVRTAISLFS